MRFLSERNEIGFVIIGGAKKSRFSSQGDRPPKTGHGRPNLGVDNMHYSREILLSPPVCDFLLVSRMMLLHTWADFELSTHVVVAKKSVKIFTDILSSKIFEQARPS